MRSKGKACSCAMGPVDRPMFAAWWVGVVVAAGCLAWSVPAPAGVDGRRPPVRETVEGPWAAFAPAAAAARWGVVAVRDGRATVALATVIDTDGHALTKASELPDGDTARIAWRHGRTLPARVIGTDRATDLALLKIEATHLPPTGLHTSHADADAEPAQTAKRLAPGAWLISVAPTRTPLAAGIVSVQPRAIPARRVLIGVEIRPDDAGPRIRSVIPGMGADHAGLERGDVITHVGGEPMRSRDDVVTRLKGMARGDTIEVKVRRDDKDISFTIDLAPLPLERLDRSARMNRMGGPLSERAHGFERVIQHDTVLGPDQVGGPVVDLDGRVVGINIARAGRIATYALPLDLALDTAERIHEQARTLVSDTADGPSEPAPSTTD